MLPGNQEYGRVVALQTYVLHIGCAYGPAVACGGSDPRVGIKGKRLLRNNLWMFQACELGLPCKAEIGFRNRPFLAEINFMVIKDDVWLKILPCLNSYRCLSRIINHLELEN
jgi:hypothetical protein